MKGINLKNKTMIVKGTPLAIHFYKQAFKSDVINDLFSMLPTETMEENPKKNVDTVEMLKKIDASTTLQIAYAMNKCGEFGNNKTFPTFEGWLVENEELGILEEGFLTDVLLEAIEGLIPSSKILRK